MKTIWGNEYHDTWTYWSFCTLLDASNMMHLAIACPATDEWLDVCLGYAKRSYELGCKAVFYDYWVLQPAWLCFDMHHNHKKPALAYGPGINNILKTVKEEMRKIDLDFAIGTEGVTDASGIYVDFFQGAGHGFQAPAGPDDEGFGELFRYTFPEWILFSRGIALEDYKNTNYSFVYGFRFGFDFGQHTFKDSLGLAAYSKRLCEIRNKHADLLLEGIFVDDEGFNIDNSRLVAKAFKSNEGEKYAVLIWNPSDTEEEYFNVTVPGYKIVSAHTIEEDLRESPKKIEPQKVVALIYAKV
jgi:hypothetical protein